MAKLVIVYDTKEGDTHQLEYGDTMLPVFYGSGSEQCLTFCKGILAEREIEFSRIVEVYTTTVIYSAYDEGLEVLGENAE